MNLYIHYSERVYNFLLLLYPLRFRIRFAPEMAQLFHDMCYDALEKGEIALVAAFWVRTMRDIFLSVLRERRRALIGPVDVKNPFTGVIDVVLIPSMVAANLLVLGPVLTLLFRGGTDLPMDQFAVTSAFFSVAIGTLSVTVSMAFTRLRPTNRLWVKLSA